MMISVFPELSWLPVCQLNKHPQHTVRIFRAPFLQFVYVQVPKFSGHLHVNTIHYIV